MTKLGYLTTLNDHSEKKGNITTNEADLKDPVYKSNLKKKLHHQKSTDIEK